MKFTCLQENLNQGLSIISHIKSPSSSLPILNNVLLEVKNGALILSTTDLEIGIKTIIRSKVKEEGKFTVPIQLLTNYVNFLPNKQIDVELTKDFLILNCAHHQTKIKGIDANEFPLIPQIERTNKYSFKTKEVKKAIQQTSFTINPSEVRSEISGILFHFNFPQLGKITLVGTDSYRLVENIISFDNHGRKEEKKLIIPLKTIQQLGSILKENNEDVEIFFTENQILFSFNETEIISRLILGEYPNYKQIIPQLFKTEIICHTDEFIRTIKGAGLFSRTGINDINLQFKDNKIIISSVNTQLGENVSEVEADIKGEENNITFNYRYLLDGLQNIAGDEMFLGIVNQKTPGMIKRPDSKDLVYIIMPIGE